MFQITLVNERYFKLVSDVDGDTNFGLLMTPRVLTEALRRIAESYGGEDAAMRILGSVSSHYEPVGLSGLLDYPDSFSDLPFGRWMSRNDSHTKTVVLDFKKYRDFTEIEIRGLCTVLVNSETLGVTRNNLVNQSFCDGCESSESVPLVPAEQCRTNNSSSSNTIDNNTNRQIKCGLIFYLKKYKELSRTRSDVASIRDNLSEKIGSYLCSNNAHACLRLPSDSAVRHALILCVVDYIFVHLMQYVLHRTAAMYDAGVTTTRSQRDLALGYTVSKDASVVAGDIAGNVPGILEHDNSDRDTNTGEKKNSLLNCYDTPYAKTNFMWKGL